LRTLSVILCSVLVALVGCGGSSNTGTVTGTLRFVGGPPDPSRPPGRQLHKQSGRMILLDSGGQTVAAQQLRSGQEYRFQVAASSYQLVLVASGGGQKLCSTPVHVAVGQTVDKSLNCVIP
jgi:hypothetical protein